MLPLTLRPTDIGTPPAFQHLKDYCVYEDGEEIGRIYETHAPSRPGLAWFWSLYLMGGARGHGKANGHAATFDEAKAEFWSSLERFRAWPQP